MTSKPRIALAAGAVAAVAGISLAGCGNGSKAPASQPAGSAQPAQTLTASPGAGAATSTSGPGAASPDAQSSVNPGGPAVTAGRGECTASQLKIAYTDNSQIKNGALDGMSHVDSVVTFTNDGSAPCRTQGYPGVAALNSAGTQIKQAARATGTAPLITLEPGQTASALIAANSASCSAPVSVAGLLVTAPDQRTSTHLGPAGQMCLNSLTVNPLKPGNAGGLSL
jgi:hypothetical protein